MKWTKCMRKLIQICALGLRGSYVQETRPNLPNTHQLTTSNSEDEFHVVSLTGSVFESSEAKSAFSVRCLMILKFCVFNFEFASSS